jgi:hypothetical protein
MVFAIAVSRQHAGRNAVALGELIIDPLRAGHVILPNFSGSRNACGWILFRL